MIIRIMGGLGNQMFQYACYRNLIHQGKKVELDFSKDNAFNSKLYLFPNINIRKTSLLTSKILANRFLRKLLKTICVYGTQNDDNKKDYNFRYINEGYFQSEIFFADIKSQIIEEFTFPAGEDKLEDLANKVKGYKESVSIHIRRGDYIELNSIYGNICTEKYYDSAISMFSSNTNFVVFSNDMCWVKENLKIPNAIYISGDMFEHYEDWYDMYLMSICKNNIIANSTFSWWGAYLNVYPSKKVICPTKWNNNSDRKMKIDRWIEIDNIGKVIN